MKKRPVVFLIAAVIGLVLAIFLPLHLSRIMDKFSLAKENGYYVPPEDVYPYLDGGLMINICSFATAVISLAWILKWKWASLIAGIMYAFSILVLPIWFYIPLVPMILCFVGYAQMNKADKTQTPQL